MADRYIPAKGQKFKVLLVRPGFGGKVFVSEGKVVGNKLHAHLLDYESTKLRLNLAQCIFKHCE